MTTTYRAISVKAGSLLLDSKNSRIPAERRSDDQRQLLHELLEREDIRGLASKIAKLGLFPNERLVVMSEGRRYIVLEGNRRLAAIRLLINPDLAPTDASVKYFRNLSVKTDLPGIGKLDVAVFQNRVAAAPIIAASHIGNPKRRWSSLQQARFYLELVEEGQTPAEVAERIGTTPGHVREFLRTEKLYRIASSFEYNNEVRQKIEDPKFPLTTLARFIESTLGRKFLGIKLDDAYGFWGVVHPDRFKAVLTRVAEEVATKPGLTRKINDEKDWNTYINKIKPTIPKTKIRGKFNPDYFLGTEDIDAIPDEQEPKKKQKPRAPKPSASIIPRGFVCRSKHDRVRAVFNELKSMKIEQQRNSSGVMLRVLMDIALWHFFCDNGHEKAVCDHFDKNKKQRKRNSDWTPSLRSLISYAVEKRIFPGVTAAGYKSVRSLASRDTEYMITIESFNAFTHNPYITPTEGDLRALWQRAEPMLEIILN